MKVLEESADSTALEFDSDVLVVGGGLAGMMAALSAREENAEVVLVCTGTFGESGDSAIASGGFAIAVNDASGDNVDVHLDDTVRSGRGLSDPDVARSVAHGAPAMLERLSAYGVDFAAEDDGELAFAPIPGHRFPRSVRCRGGGTGALMGPLTRAVAASGVRVLDETFVDALVRENGHVRGATITDQRRGRRGRVSAVSTVLATGGLGQLYTHTSNNPDVFGSGYALALEAGCSVVDMEFVQFTPTALVAPAFAAGMSPGGALMAQPGVVLRNAHGRRFMPDYDPENAECTTRDVLARAIHQEVTGGRGTENGGVYLDLSGTSRERIADISGRFLRAMDAGGFDPFANRVEVAPEAHFCMGGIAVTTEGATEVPGLFATGEAAVGLHGANRLNSNALTEAAVLGDITGRAAADDARAAGLRSLTSWPAQDRQDDSSAGPLRWGDLDALVSRLRTTVQACGGVIRSESSLLDGLRRLEEIGRQAAAYTPATWQEEQQRIVVGQMSLAARAVLTAALHRTESRGSHFREDHADLSDAGPVHYVLRLRSDGGLETSEVRAGGVADRVAVS